MGVHPQYHGRLAGRHHSMASFHREEEGLVIKRCISPRAVNLILLAMIFI